jgi:enoyl-[acyl-carrier protein] reductase I
MRIKKIEHGVERQDDRDHRDPLRRTVEADEVGRTALMLASDYTTAITGEVLYVDAGFNVAGMVFH